MNCPLCNRPLVSHTWNHNVKDDGRRYVCFWCPPAGFTCPRCGAVSYSPTDAEAGYCGRCHDWTRLKEPQ